MRHVVLSLILLTGASAGASQEPTHSPGPAGETGTSITGPGYRNLPKQPPSDIDTKPIANRNGYTRPDAATRRKRYVNSLVGPVTIGRQAFNAGISTWRNSPEEWGTKWEGFGRRFASNMGRNAIRQTILYGLDSALNVDSHFYRSGKKDFGSRFKNAVISPVTARKPNGKRVISIPRITATYTSSIIAYETWYPDRYNWKDGMKNGTISFGMNAGFNLIKEFIWKKK